MRLLTASIASRLGRFINSVIYTIRLCYLHFAPENPEDSEMYLLVLAHLCCPGQSPESHKMIVVVVLCLLSNNYYNQATGYATQHSWCLSQAWINWQGCQDEHPE